MMAVTRWTRPRKVNKKDDRRETDVGSVGCSQGEVDDKLVQVTETSKGAEERKGAGREQEIYTP